jgi:branched-chain amino acid transport system permease protein
MLQPAIDGVALGSTYVLLAIGVTLVFGVLRRVNLAYGATIALSLYLVTWLDQRVAVSPLLLVLIAVLVAIAAGAYVERLCFFPHLQHGPVTSMTAAFAVSMQLQEIATLLLPRHSNAFPSLFVSATDRWSDGWRLEQWTALGCAVVASVGTWSLLYRTRFGLAVRALTEDSQGALCVGIHRSRVLSAIFAVASALGLLGGYLIVSMQRQITPMFAMWSLFKGLIAAVLGGLGSFPGAIIGGLGLGMMESYLQSLFGSQYRDLGSYLLLLLLLALYPRGLSALWTLDRERHAVDEN